MSGSEKGPTIEGLDASAYTVPTDQPESDGTLAWDSTTMVLVEAAAGDARGLGYSYTHAAAAQLIESTLAEQVKGTDAMAVYQAQRSMVQAIRNLGRSGICACAISAVDIALWDLKARLLDRPLVDVLNRAHDAVPIYGSGGFCSYSPDRLRAQLSGWVDEGMTMVKMKVGRHPDDDPDRVETARDAIGDDAELFVDANGAYGRKSALYFGDVFAERGVTWFEEPVSSDDLEGLRLIRKEGPPRMDIAAGEYGYDLYYFRDMLQARAVDVLQADVTRCGGITSFLAAGELVHAHAMDLSAHTAPHISAHAMCAIPRMRHIEYFHDHVRIEQMLFDGALTPKNGMLEPDRSRSGMGLTFKHADAEPYQVYP
jgi:L-alanine-DL-glutamate epimerase-like enolase superfamily enzyme